MPTALSEADKQAVERGLRIAHLAVHTAVTSECSAQKLPGGAVLYDTRPMTDPWEHSPSTVDWHCELLSYGESAGLLARDSADRHMVRLLRQAPQ